ncbi:hypothetical protein COV53_02125 [Candidatus Gottesmanbacteria bacterium CG11_big_fil_rev_8_21_14_0_20_37_11]|uniref:Signal peptidase I n=3 Tax=Candidatus Gottesmaniibacteriota TaxID=1752720 RepID=A0A2M7RQ42_9BACT|nr:MAG: hypothetical protein AUJ73_01365 [Candidatus Gottesmanbacteria bacterium CG1_02_37_22]PIR08613.1 MAG: hypothetical protein COV53_02125 [Candidatus Gottesmanbacteria bacterium CG11_big_fil_rev_8_21_14_0_20_37_11]PIZ02290.1 MAG: hypothetical protein COY59_05550 [Candidatus Gottesmanbacteria bacterium CG_4_10_14_0_8_um_filter_37_24]
MHRIVSSLKKKNNFVIKSLGTSMLPTLHPKDVAYIKKISFGNVKVNDILMVEKGRNVLIHRVIYKTPGIIKTTPFLVTKGDNNQTSDGKIYAKQVIGKLYQYKRGNYVSNMDEIYLIQSTYYYQEIVKIKKELEKYKVDFVFLKGLPIHLFFEKKQPGRIYADCDILIDKNKFEKIQNIFVKNGYIKYRSEYSKLHRMLKDKQTEVAFFKQTKDIDIVFDVHFEPVFMMNQLGKLDALYPEKLMRQMNEEFLCDKKIIKVNNETFPILSIPNLIIYLSLHLFHHNFRKIFRLELINIILNRLEFMTNKKLQKDVTDRIVKYKLGNYIYPVFVLLQKYYYQHFTASFLNKILPSEEKKRYISNNILPVDVFSHEDRIKSGITRFKNLYFLAPTSILRKNMIFFYPSVLHMIFWVGMKKIKRNLKLSFS